MSSLQTSWSWRSSSVTPSVARVESIIVIVENENLGDVEESSSQWLGLCHSNFIADELRATIPQSPTSNWHRCRNYHGGGGGGRRLGHELMWRSNHRSWPLQTKPFSDNSVNRHGGWFFNTSQFLGTKWSPIQHYPKTTTTLFVLPFIFHSLFQ